MSAEEIKSIDPNILKSEMILALNNDPHTIASQQALPSEGRPGTKHRPSMQANGDLVSEIVTEVIGGEETPH